MSEPKERGSKELLTLLELGCLKHIDLGGSSIYHVLFAGHMVCISHGGQRGSP